MGEVGGSALPFVSVSGFADALKWVPKSCLIDQGVAVMQRR